MTPDQRANELISELGLQNKKPLPLQKIVEHLGYKVTLFKPTAKTRNVVSGVDQKQKILMASADETVPEQRYCFAHSIAHILLNPGENIIDRKTNLHPEIDDDKEKAANMFADELLMESHLFLTKWDETDGDLNKLANAFGLAKDRIVARAKSLDLV